MTHLDVETSHGNVLMTNQATLLRKALNPCATIEKGDLISPYAITVMSCTPTHVMKPMCTKACLCALLASRALH